MALDVEWAHSIAPQAKILVVEAAPDIDSQLMREFWLGATEGSGKKLVELITLPSLNIRGMASSRIGAQASNVIPATAAASLDIRLVKGMDHAHEYPFGFFVKRGYSRGP